MSTAGIIFMALLWAFMLGVIGFAVWSGIVVGRVQGVLLVAMCDEYRRDYEAHKKREKTPPPTP